MRSWRARQADADEVGQQGVVEVGRGGGGAGLLALDDLAGHADDDRVGRYGLDHDGVGADAAVAADRDRAEDLGAGADGHPVADGGVALAAVAGWCRRG